MPYVNRDTAGNIIASFANEQFAGQEFVSSLPAPSLSQQQAQTKADAMALLQKLDTSSMNRIQAAIAMDTTGTLSWKEAQAQTFLQNRQAVRDIALGKTLATSLPTINYPTWSL